MKQPRSGLHDWGPHVTALGATQIIGYGTIYYAFPILVPAIAAEFGVTQTLLFGIFSAGLLLGGLVAPFFGQALDRFGAARVMAAGSAIVTGLCLGLAWAPDLWTFAACIILLEAISFLVLYDAAFATLADKEPRDTRTAITRLTLIGGFASTLFWPLTGILGDLLGWRGTYLAFAALHFLLALPLHLRIAQTAPRADTPRLGGPAPRPVWAFVPKAAQRRAFWLLGTSFAVTGMVIAAMGVHLVPVLLARELGAGAYLAGMLMGPAQVAIRLIEATFWRQWHPLRVAMVSGIAIPAALALLLLPIGGIVPAMLMALAFGAGQGLASIVRGSVPLALFGAAGIGRRLGLLAGLRSVLGAAAPFLFALGMTQLGVDATLIASILLAGAGLVLLALLSRVVWGGLRPPSH